MSNLSISELIIIKRINSRIRFKRAQNSNSEIFSKMSQLRSLRLNQINSYMENFIENSLKSYIIFLEYLKEEKPLIEKINENLLISHYNIQISVDFWERNPEINNLNLKSKLLYCLFLKNVLHQEEKGDEIFEDFFSKIKKKIKDSNDLSKIEFEDLKTFSMNPSPICLLKRESDHLYVKSCNKQFGALIGRAKFQLEGKEINTFIHKSSSDLFRQIFVTEMDGIHELWKRKTITFRLNSPKGSLMRLVKFYSCDFKMFKRGPNEAYCMMKINMKAYSHAEAKFLVESTGKIVAYDNDSLGLFGIKRVEEANRLKDIGLKLSREDMGQKEASKVVQKMGKGKIRILELKTSSVEGSNLYLLRVTEESGGIRTIATSTKLINTSSAGEQKNQGSIFEKTHNLHNSFAHMKKVNEARPLKFQFSLNHSINSYHGRFVTKEEAKNSNTVEVTKSILYFIDENLKNSQRVNEVTEKINYAEDIKTKRLVYRGIVEINDSFDSLDFEDDQNSGSYKSPHAKRKMLKSIFKKKTESFDRKINENSFENKLKNLKVKKTIARKFFIVFMIMTSLFHFLFPFYTKNVKIEELKITKNLLEIVSRLGIRNDAFVNIASRFHDIMITNQGVNMTRNFDPNITKREFLEENLEYFELYFNELMEYEVLILENLDRFPDSQAVEILNSDEIYLITYEGGEKNYTFEDAVNQIYANILQVLTLDVEDIKPGRSEVDFLWRNIVAPYLKRFPPLNVIRYGARDKLRIQLQKNFNNFLMMSFGFSIASTFIYFIFIHFFYKELEKAVFVFYGFSQDYIKRALVSSYRLMQALQTSYSTEDVEEIFLDLKSEDGEDGTQTKYEEEKNAFGLKKRKKKKGTILPFLGLFKISFFFINFVYCLLAFYDEQRYLTLAQTGITLSDSFSTIGSCTAATHLFEAFVEFFAYDKASLSGKVPNSIYARVFVGQAISDSNKFYKVKKQLIFPEYHFVPKRRSNHGGEIQGTFLFEYVRCL